VTPALSSASRRRRVKILRDGGWSVGGLSVRREACAEGHTPANIQIQIARHSVDESHGGWRLQCCVPEGSGSWLGS
jgi:hypothetical protein